MTTTDNWKTEVLPREDVTPDVLKEAAHFFSQNYGIWGNTPPSVREIEKPGNPVKMSSSRLAAQSLPENSRSSYARITTADGKLLADAFASRWDFRGRQVCWVTQLVVRRDHRRRGLATALLKAVSDDKDDICGIMSSHPAACKALAKARAPTGSSIAKIPLDFIKANAAEITKSSPTNYIANAELRGSLFGPDKQTEGLVCGADSAFFVDHTEPLQALATIKAEGDGWPLGELPEGHEYLILFDRK